MHGSKTVTSERRLWFLSVATILPAIALGILAMIADGVSPLLWGQQAVAFVVCALLGLLRRSAQKVPCLVWTAVCLSALAVTLFFPAVGGVRRWLDLGIFNVNAGMLVLPALLVLLSGMRCAYPALLFGAAVLCFQPDFSQLTAFSLGALPVLWRKGKPAVWSAVSMVFLAACLLYCAGVPTALEPAAHSEGILALLSNLSPLMRVAGWLALALIPGYFVRRFLERGSSSALCLAIYYATVILFSLTGQYPVPFMGFGLSPIVGYYLAHLLL